MNRGDFEGMIRNMRNAYGLTMFRARRGEEESEVVDYLYAKCGHIPADAAEGVEEKYKSQNDRPPAKMDEAILRAYRAWLNDQPRQQGDDDRRTCRLPECDNGFLHLRKDGAVYCFRCLDCQRRADHQKHPWMRLEVALRQGYTVDGVISRPAPVQPRFKARSDMDLDKVMAELEWVKDNKPAALRVAGQPDPPFWAGETGVL